MYKNSYTTFNALSVFFRIVYGMLCMNADYRYLLRELMGWAAALHTLWRLLSSPSLLAADLPGRRLCFAGSCTLGG
jgi:hypothetical protein